MTPKISLIFDGKFYNRSSKHHKKSTARLRADFERRQGYNARIIKSGSYWWVYRRKK